MSTYDALIVGAGPAGCAAAYDLAAAGRRVLLLDKRAFPRHKACACGLTRKTLKALRYSVDPVVERVCHEIVLQPADADARVGDKSREVRVRTRTPICAMAVRERFDAFCLEQTLACGAELRKIEGIVALREADGVVEVDVSLANGATEVLRAQVLIGADGSNGQTRRLAAALHSSGSANASALPPEPNWYERGFALEATVPYGELPASLPGGDAPHDLVFDFAPLPGGYGWLFPKGDHINIGVGAFAPRGTTAGDERLKLVTRKLLAEYTFAKLGTALPAHVTGQYLGMGGHAYVPRGRVLLVGDAAGLVDPLTGEGIHSAIVSGQAAAAAVLSKDSEAVSETYARRLQPLQETLRFSERAARAFYAQPERGFRAMRLPVLRSMVLKTYADGLPYTKLLTGLAKTMV